MRAVELFCGAGGMSRGLIDAGIEVVKAFDAWPVAVENYRENIAPHAEVADLKNLLSIIPEISRLTPDLICGGPPCQDYSLAGRRQEGENASLTIAFAIAVTAVRPQWFLMENVIQAARSDAWAEARAMLERAGYGLSESRVTASRYGVPQNRRRLFVIGRLGERRGFLQSAVAGAASAQPMTLRDFFGSVTSDGVSFPAKSQVQRTVWSSDTRALAVLERSVMHLPEPCRPHPADVALLENGFVYSRPLRDGRGVRTIDEPMTTITRTSWERPTSRYLSAPHPDDPVLASDTAVLTVDQISRVQGFPKDWRWIGTSKRDKLQMIANAVPAPVARTLGEVILARHRGQTAPAIEGRFLDWLQRGGRKRSTARNVKANVNRARRLLEGKSFAEIAMELVALEAVIDFAELPKNTRSDLRQALILYAEFEASKTSRTKRRKAAATIIVDMVPDAELAKAA